MRWESTICSRCTPIPSHPIPSHPITPPQNRLSPLHLLVRNAKPLHGLRHHVRLVHVHDGVPETIQTNECKTRPSVNRQTADSTGNILVPNHENMFMTASLRLGYEVPEGYPRGIQEVSKRYPRGIRLIEVSIHQVRIKCLRVLGATVTPSDPASKSINQHLGQVIQIMIYLSTNR